MSIEELKILLSLTQDIPGSQEHNELLSSIFERIRPILDYDLALLYLWEEGGLHYKVAVADELSEATSHPTFDHLTQGPLEPVGSPYEVFEQLTEPALFTPTVWLDKYSNFPSRQLITDFGYVEQLVLPLRDKNSSLGLVEFFSRSEDKLKREDVELYKLTADQMSTVLVNLLTIEELEKRKSQQELMLDLSKDITALADRNALLQFINTRVKEVFDFYDANLILISDDHEHHWDLVTKDDSSIDIRPLRLWEDPKIHRLHRHSPIEWLVDKSSRIGGPVLFDFRELSLNYPNYLPFISNGVERKSGLATNLKSKRKTIGVLYVSALKEDLFSDKEFMLFQALADHIAIALQSILAKEEANKRREEKEIMLRISEQINQARSRDDIMHLMRGELKNLFGFEYTSMVFLDHIGKKYSQWIINPSDNLAQKKAFRQIQKVQLPIEGSFFEKILSQSEIVSISTQEIIDNHPDYGATRLYKDFNLKSFVVVPLIYADQYLGLWTLNSTSKNLLNRINKSLLENTASQLAIAVSSLLANEEIVERERIKSLQIGIQTAFNRHKRLSDKLKEMMLIFKKIIPFDYVSFNLDLPNEVPRGVGFELLNNDEYRMITPPEFFRLLGIDDNTFRTLIDKDQLDECQCYNGKKFKGFCNRNELIALYKEHFEVESCFRFPIKLSVGGKFRIEFYTKSDEGYLADYQQLFERLKNSLTTSIDKFIAQEEIIRLNQQLNQEKQYLEEEININYNFGELVGESLEIKKVFKKIEQVAKTDTTVLITGETGTGKEVIARAIHNSSDRKNKPLVKLNCAALPPQLMESELFGHEKGSFTGATSRRVGKFELANKGTIFLDEIGEMPLELQAKLLRVIQEKEVERIGGNTVINVDVRIISATNRNLEEEITKNVFRSDLFYRLNVFPIHIPPLRERQDDILPLVNHFLKTKSKRVGKKMDLVSSEAAKQLFAYTWPGNIRELEHVVERGIILSQNNTLKINLTEDMPFAITDRSNNYVQTQGENRPFQTRTIVEVEKELIINTLVFTNGRVRGEGGAAQLLGLKPTTLEARMKKLGIKKNISYKKEV